MRRHHVAKRLSKSIWAAFETYGELVERTYDPDYLAELRDSDGRDTEPAQPEPSYKDAIAAGDSGCNVP